MRFLNFGCGVNSVSIVALMVAGKVKPVDYIVFADTGAEKQETYEYLEYFKTVCPYPIEVVQSKEGSLLDYCRKKVCLPSIYPRWCTDRWKKKPLEKFRRSKCDEEQEVFLIGIAQDESKRAQAWRNQTNVEFPLLELHYSRQDCIDEIVKAGWKVPIKSGCFFCPFSNVSEFAQLRTKHPEQFKEICDLEKQYLERLTENRIRGWFNPNLPLTAFVDRKVPQSCIGQKCLYCWD